MKSTKRELLLLTSAVLTIYLLTGCQQSKGGVGYSVSDMIQYEKDAEKANLMNVIETESEAFDRHFSKGRYWEKYDDLELALNKEFAKIVEKEINVPEECYSFYRAKNVYFKDSLEKLKKGELTIADIMSDPVKHIWEMKIRVYGGEEVFSDKKEATMYEKFEAFNQKYNELGIHRMDNRIIFSDVLDSEKGTIKASLAKDPEDYLMNNKTCGYARKNTNGKDNTVACIADNILSLKEKYHEDFVYVNIGTNEDGTVDPMYAPISDLSLAFIYKSDFLGDKYLATLAQRAMYEEIEKIIEEEGYGGKIAHLTIPDPRFTDENVKPDNERIDMREKYTNVEIINKVYKGSYHTVLNLLLEPEEEIDYGKMKNIAARIQGLITDEYSNDGPDNDPKMTRISLECRNTTYINFISLTKEDIRIVLDMFERDWTAGNYFREESNLVNMWANFSYEREDTDGFKIIEIYGNESDPSLKIVGAEKSIFEATVDTFKQRLKK